MKKKPKSFAISMYKRWYKPGYCIKRTWNIITISVLEKQKAFHDKRCFYWRSCERLNSAAIAIVEIQLRSVGDTEAQLATRFRSRRSSSDLSAFWTDLCARESTHGDLGDHGNQLETNQRSICALGDLGTVRGVLADRRLVEWGY